ncbi:hypothetical protein [Pseudochrobactrum sp. MP213Fo]|uniref:hypothetical protein n=1 Tax=Pseudochrobactrum sp. MP213Fo TaxID=3022250 RepID=UPI003BA2A0FE
MIKCATAAAFLLLSAASALPALASDKDEAFFRNVEGQWTGPGEVVAGKYKGTKFICTLAGTTPDNSVGMTLDGTCRVGVFSQPMKATVIRTGKSYSGTFNDGAEGKGLNVTSGSVSGNRVVLALNRKQLNGAMLARVTDANTMNVTVSVKVEDTMVPVLGVNLKRVDGGAVSSIARN